LSTTRDVRRSQRRGYPPPKRYAVRRCLRAIVREEWQHRLYAERDLDVVEGLERS
jgi:hypothetical protein